MFGMLMSLHISSFMLGKVFGSALTAAFGVTSGNFTNLANSVMVRAARPILLLFFSQGGQHIKPSLPCCTSMLTMTIVV